MDEKHQVIIKFSSKRMDVNRIFSSLEKAMDFVMSYPIYVKKNREELDEIKIRKL